jgi:hypothetical protein
MHAAVIALDDMHKTGDRCMKQGIAIALSMCLAAEPLQFALAQVAAPAGQKSLAATLNVYAFPMKGQTVAVQDQDQAACYQFAVQNTGVDPFSLQKQAQQQQQHTTQEMQQAKEAGRGAGAVGAAGGAAAGALIGSFSDDAGKGAGIGAAFGFLAGRHRRRMAEEQAAQHVQQQGQQAQQATQQEMTNFKKAFSVCLKAKNYMVEI